MARRIDPFDPGMAVTALMAAANLIGVITSDRALEDARKNFDRWRGTAHSCMLYQMMKTQRSDDARNVIAQIEVNDPDSARNPGAE